MTGLENIATHNGWAMAAVGISIVFSGLVLLSFAISQLHRILALFKGCRPRSGKENGRMPPFSGDQPDSPPSLVADSTVDIKNIDEIIRNYKMITHRIGEPFSLPKLLDLAEKHGLAKPYSTVNTLIMSDIIAADGNGLFIWKK